MRCFSVNQGAAKQRAANQSATSVGSASKKTSLEPKVACTPLKGSAGFTLEYEFPGFLFYHEDRNAFQIDGREKFFTQLKIPGAGFLNEAYKPLLPSFGRYLQIDSNYVFYANNELNANFTVDNLVTIPCPLDALRDEIGDEILVSRSEFELSDWSRTCFGPDMKEDFFRGFYDRKVDYPKKNEIAKVTGPYLIDGRYALLVHVRPFQYKYVKYGPTFKYDLVFYNNISLDITLGNASGGTAFVSVDSGCCEDAFENLFFNPGASTAGEQTQDDDLELLIVYTDAKMKKAAEKLGKWKNKKGLNTEVVSVAQIPKKSSTQDLREDIWDYAVNRGTQGSTRFRYLLLFGDVNAIPIETGANSDFFYSTPPDWKNTKLVFPWLSCGRVPVDTEAEAENVVGKIIEYERSPTEDKEYYKKMTFCAYLEDSAHYWQKRVGRLDRKDSSNYVKTMEDILQHLEDPKRGFQVERIYVQEKGTIIDKYCNGEGVPRDVTGNMLPETSAKASLINAANHGRLIIGHRGHASSVKWLVPRFDPEFLRPNAKPSIFFSLNCLTGRFYQKPDCMGEKLLKHEGGAPSLIAPTRSSNTWLNNSMMKALFDALWPGILKTFPPRSGTALKHNRLGDIMNYAKAYLPIAQSNADSKIKRHFEIYHILGDPSLELWKSPPRDFEFSASLQPKQQLEIKAANANSFPPGTVFTICWEDGAGFEAYRRFRNVSSSPLKDYLGNIFEKSWPKDGFYVCFHAPGYRFKEEHVSMIKGNPASTFV